MADNDDNVDKKNTKNDVPTRMEFKNVLFTLANAGLSSHSESEKKKWIPNERAHS